MLYLIIVSSISVTITGLLTSSKRINFEVFEVNFCQILKHLEEGSHQHQVFLIGSFNN